MDTETLYQIINELTQELQCLRTSIAEDCVEEELLRQENSKLQARNHLEYARRRLRKLEAIESYRNQQTFKELSSKLVTLCRRTLKYRALVAQKKEQNKSMVITIQTFIAELAPQKKSKRRGFVVRLGQPSRMSRSSTASLYLHYAAAA
jgi:regulator of replication initiation timing